MQCAIELVRMEFCSKATLPSSKASDMHNGKIYRNTGIEMSWKIAAFKWTPLTDQVL
jgi:hypothetical protein